MCQRQIQAKPKENHELLLKLFPCKLAQLRTVQGFALVGATVLSGCGPSNLLRGVQNPFSYGICGLLVIVLDVLALVEVWKRGRSDSDKILWTAVIIILPFVGLIAYYLFDRK